MITQLVAYLIMLVLKKKLKIIAIDLSKQHDTHADSKVIYKLANSITRGNILNGKTKKVRSKIRFY